MEKTTSSIFSSDEEVLVHSFGPFKVTMSRSDKAEEILNDWTKLRLQIKSELKL